jgi:hypothetical protein
MSAIASIQRTAGAADRLRGLCRAALADETGDALAEALR